MCAALIALIRDEVRVSHRDSLTAPLKVLTQHRLASLLKSNSEFEPVFLVPPRSSVVVLLYHGAEGLIAFFGEEQKKRLSLSGLPFTDKITVCDAMWDAAARTFRIFNPIMVQGVDQRDASIESRTSALRTWLSTHKQHPSDRFSITVQQWSPIAELSDHIKSNVPVGFEIWIIDHCSFGSPCGRTYNLYKWVHKGKERVYFKVKADSQERTRSIANLWASVGDGIENEQWYGSLRNFDSSFCEGQVMEFSYSSDGWLAGKPVCNGTASDFRSIRFAIRETLACVSLQDWHIFLTEHAKHRTKKVSIWNSLPTEVVEDAYADVEWE